MQSAFSTHTLLPDCQSKLYCVLASPSIIARDTRYSNNKICGLSILVSCAKIINPNHWSVFWPQSSLPRIFPHTQMLTRIRERTSCSARRRHNNSWLSMGRKYLSGLEELRKNMATGYSTRTQSMNCCWLQSKQLPLGKSPSTQCGLIWI